MTAAPELLPFIRRPAVLSVDPRSRHGAAVAPLFEAIEREAMTQERWQFAAGMSLTLALFVQIARISQDAELAANPARTRMAARIERFRALLDAHCRRRRSVQTYARAMGVTSGN